MSSLNKVQLIGNVGRDPETRTFQNGGQVCNFSIATSNRWTDKETGEVKEVTHWHNIAIFNEHLVKIAEQYIHKGSKVYVEGAMETRKWQDRSGNDRYSTEVVLRPFSGQIVLLGDKGESSRSSGSRDDGPPRKSSPRQKQSSMDEHMQSRRPSRSQKKHTAEDLAADGFDDEIPF